MNAGCEFNKQRRPDPNMQFGGWFFFSNEGSWLVLSKSGITSDIWWLGSPGAGKQSFLLRTHSQKKPKPKIWKKYKSATIGG